MEEGKASVVGRTAHEKVSHRPETAQDCVAGGRNRSERESNSKSNMTERTLSMGL